MGRCYLVMLIGLLASSACSSTWGFQDWIAQLELRQHFDIPTEFV